MEAKNLWIGKQVFIRSTELKIQTKNSYKTKATLHWHVIVQSNSVNSNIHNSNSRTIQIFILVLKYPDKIVHIPI